MDEQADDGQLGIRKSLLPFGTTELKMGVWKSSMEGAYV